MKSPRFRNPALLCALLFGAGHAQAALPAPDLAPPAATTPPTADSPKTVTPPAADDPQVMTTSPAADGPQVLTSLPADSLQVLTSLPADSLQLVTTGAAEDLQALISPATEEILPPTWSEALQFIEPAFALPELAVAEPLPAFSTGATVFARISKGLSGNACAAGSNSERWRRRYAGNPRAFSDQLEKMLPLLDFVSIEVERAGLPAEFVFIPLVESRYDPAAMGPGGPAGMWQMIASTARNHGIHIKPDYDGRLSPVESTRAALSYLDVLHQTFGNWQATVMAYNAGEGRMANAFKRANNRDVSAANRKPHGLSNITYDYVAKLQALSCLVTEPGRAGLTLPTWAKFAPLAPFLMDAGVRDLDQFAAQYGHDRQALRRLNPGFKSGRVAAGVPRLVLTPFGQSKGGPASGTEDIIATPVASAQSAPPPLLGVTTGQVTTHQVNAGESLWSISRLHSMTIDELRRLNRLGRNSLVKPGQTLKLVP